MPKLTYLNIGNRDQNSNFSEENKEKLAEAFKNVDEIFI